MKTAIAIFLILPLAAAVAQFLLARKFLGALARQEEAIRTAPIPEARDPGEIPEVMRRFAEKG